MHRFGPHMSVAGGLSHASYLINSASDNGQLRQQSFDAMADELDRAEALALTGVVLHPGCYTTGTSHDGLDRVGAALVERLDARPVRDTMILLEGAAGQGTSLGRTFEELATIVARTNHHPPVGICLDTCHLLAAGYDLSTAVGYATTFDRFDAVVGLDRLRVLHLQRLEATARKPRRPA